MFGLCVGPSDGLLGNLFIYVISFAGEVEIVSKFCSWLVVYIDVLFLIFKGDRNCNNVRLDLWLMYGSGNSAMPDCDGDCFNNVANAGFWSSTSYAPRNDGKDEAWMLSSGGSISSSPVKWDT